MTSLMTKPRTTEAVASPISLFRREMEDLVSRFWDGEAKLGSYMPTVDLLETENAYEARMDLPGMEGKDIDIQVRGNAVTISGTRKEEKTEKKGTYHRTERQVGSFSRTLSLPCSVNEDEVVAEYNQGVLTVTLPKCEKEKARRITVKS
jgi:HSP20 family protein